jgi:uroporphyrinogen-III synthase
MAVSVLSTRVLEDHRAERLREAGIELTHYNALSFEEILQPESLALLPREAILIFSSGRAVQAYGRYFGTDHAQLPDRAYCVGAQTAGKLEKLGMSNMGMRHNADELAQLICRERPKAPLIFLSGNLRRDEIPKGLSECGLALQELPAYTTSYNEMKFNTKFQGLLFFSPSGVRSFTRRNPVGDGMVFCLGNTTAGEARQFSQRIVTAPEPDIDLMLELVLSRLSNSEKHQ